jgi:hypothetical protein
MNDCSPLCLPHEICEIIFSYLEISDLKNCCLVDKNFLEFLSSSKCVNKFVLKIDQDVNLKDVLKSKRRFTNLTVEKLQHEKLIKIFRKFHAVKRLELKDSSIAAKKGMKKFDFFYLEELTLSNISGRILFPLMKFHERLKILNVLNLRGGIETLIRFAQINENLKELNLYLNESSNIFYQDVSKVFKFGLEAITIHFKSNYENLDQTICNIETFLKSQGKSLRIITLMNVNLSTVYDIWNDLKIVEKFYFFSSDFVNVNLGGVNLEAKETLKSFEIHQLGPVELTIDEIKPLLLSAKNLKSLGVWNLNEEILKTAAENLIKLEKIFCATSTSENQHDKALNHINRFYQQLKTKSGVNSTIEIHQYL